MAVGPFLDSNILVYAYSNDHRALPAQTLCERPHILSVQSLNEFANVAKRKMGLDWDAIVSRLVSIVDLADQVVPLTFELHQTGIAIADRYKLQVYDGMILAAALEAGCEIIYSEDLQNDLLIEDRLRVINPFV